MSFFIRFFYSVATGILLSIAWYEWLTPFVMFVAFVPLLLVEEYYYDSGSPAVDVLKFSFLSFLIWNSLTTFWIFKASVIGGFAVILFNSIVMSLVFYLYHLSRRFSIKQVGRFSLLFWWLAFEYLYYLTEISWPWLTLGNGFANWVKYIQWYEFTGTLGGSLWVLFINVLVLSGLNNFVSVRAADRRKLIANIALLVGIIIIPILYSLNIYNNTKDKGESIEVVVLQPNIDPYTEKFDAISPVDQVIRLLGIAESNITSQTRYVVAPETAIVENVWEHNLYYFKSIQLVDSFVTRHNQTAFIIGADTRKEYFEGDELSPTARKFEEDDGYYDQFNSALQITERGFDIYHKSKLVFGSEMMPYYRYFRFLDKLTVDLGGTVGSLGVQDTAGVFAYGDYTTAPIICYESVYGEYVSEYVKRGAQLLTIITNDGWWGNTPGYKQHFKYARLRAIENRRSIARSANTGISAIINQRGDIVSHTCYGVQDVLKGNVSVNKEITYYTLHGDYIGRIATFFSVLLSLLLLVGLWVQKKSAVSDTFKSYENN